MIHRIRILFSIGIALLILIASMETTNAQVVYGETNLRATFRMVRPYFLGRSWQRSRYWVGRPSRNIPAIPPTSGCRTFRLLVLTTIRISRTTTYPIGFNLEPNRTIDIVDATTLCVMGLHRRVFNILPFRCL